MEIKKAIGRPTKVDIRVMKKVADAIQHNYPISDATKHAGISRATYYHYINNNSIFAEMMKSAMENRHKVEISFRTFW